MLSLSLFTASKVVFAKEKPVTRLEKLLKKKSAQVSLQDGKIAAYHYYPLNEPQNLRDLYPAIKPYATGRLEVDHGHSLYYEEVGNAKGKPVVFLHGGPGGGIAPFYRQFFNPKIWRVILLDQRGAGKSTPFASLEGNDTWSLVKDLESLRTHLKIDRWAILGGSWGATLALAYAETHPERVTGMVLRGVFMGRKSELDWLYREGAESGRVMAIALHPFVSGVPYRIGAIERAFDYICKHDGVWLATGEEIIRAYIASGAKI
jgi:pimeloyl-ACP methyl ester carboxylesterase